ncbi:dopamine receptor 2-like [Centruroides vittatus]|uniref:dopamine receptor 2-like n=1 Tax=Centruroides vittatus TaxID=120091 RepID=UPI00350F86E1
MQNTTLEIYENLTVLWTNYSDDDINRTEYLHILIYKNNSWYVNVTENIPPGDFKVLNLVLGVVLTMFCVATVFGNILVMVAVAKEQYLHSVTNYFIASLATADCLVGAIVMPFSVILQVRENSWPFGRDLCDVWHSFDVLGSTASILNLCVISLDRYWAITDPISYPRRMTTTKACVLIALVWICSALISFPAIVWWREVTILPEIPNQCEFTEDIGYLVFSSTISFYGPLTVMLFTYYRIYKAAAAQTRCLKLGEKQIQSVNGEHCTFLTLRIHRGGMLQPSHYKSSYADEGDYSEDGYERGSLRGVPRHLKNFSVSRKLAKLAKERKAAKTLAIVMGVFILCWLPFFVINVLMGICRERCQIDATLMSTVTWLGWINSGMNPVIYACWSRDFRRAFGKLLCPQSLRKRQRYRAEFCKTIREDVSMSGFKSPATEEVTL